MTRLRLGSLAALAVLTACVVLTTCRDSQGPKPSTERATPPLPSLSTSPGPVTLVGAGNIAKCGVTGAAATAGLLDSIPGTVFAAGDAAYDTGTLTQYQQCYQPSWGLHKAQPAPGDRDYKTANAAGYFGYFGAAAGDRSEERRVGKECRSRRAPEPEKEMEHEQDRPARYQPNPTR